MVIRQNPIAGFELDRHFEIFEPAAWFRASDIVSKI
jgi:hypothetical protein